MGLIKGTLEKYLNNVLLETGTYHGDGVQMALDAGFKRVYSIEVSESMAADARKRFKNNDQVIIYTGDSTETMWRIIAMTNLRMTFVLDSHFSWVDDTNEREDFNKHPLIEELKIIARHHIKTHTIILDDVRLFDTHFGTSVEEVTKLLLDINPHYEVSLIDGIVEYGVVKPEEVMVAEVKV